MSLVSSLFFINSHIGGQILHNTFFVCPFLTFVCILIYIVYHFKEGIRHSKVVSGFSAAFSFLLLACLWSPVPISYLGQFLFLTVIIFLLTIDGLFFLFAFFHYILQQYLQCSFCVSYQHYVILIYHVDKIVAVNNIPVGLMILLGSLH